MNKQNTFNSLFTESNATN